MLCSRVFRFIELKALFVWTISIASVSLDSNIMSTKCIAASHPTSWPAHNCKHPAAFLMSSFTTFITTFSAICRRTSPTPIGHIPEFFYRGMSLQAKNTSSGVSPLFVSTGRFLMHIFLMTLAKILLKSIIIAR